MLEVIYVVRHGFRANWSVDPDTGTYAATIPTPTGNPADPPLSSKGDKQATELGEHLRSLEGGIDKVVSSPYYRCLQTIRPFVEGVNGAGGDGGDDSKGYKVRLDPGFAEWYGLAPFAHPTYAPVSVLKPLFPTLELDGSFEETSTTITPPRQGESLQGLHSRVALAAEALVKRTDEEGHRSVLVCVHAAVIIAMGRVLTGKVGDWTEGDFGAYTCGVSEFRRKAPAGGDGNTDTEQVNHTSAIDKREGNPGHEDARDGAPWWKGTGVGGGWTCARNSDCNFLSGGEERGWQFSGDEAFSGAKLKDIGETEKGQDDGGVVESNSKVDGDIPHGGSRL